MSTIKTLTTNAPPTLAPDVQAENSAEQSIDDTAEVSDQVELKTQELLHLSPARRAWLRFKNNRRGYYSLWIFSLLFVISLFAELISNDKPLIVNYAQEYYFPLFNDYPETTFGGDFVSKTDYNDPYIKDKITSNGNWAVYPLNHYSYDSINYFAELPNPARPSEQNILGTDDRFCLHSF